MRWLLRWLNRRPAAEARASHDAVTEARRLAEQSQRDLDATQDQWPEVDRLARAHEKHRRRDDFKALFPEIGG